MTVELELNLEITALLYQFVGRAGTQMLVRKEILCVCKVLASHYLWESNYGLLSLSLQSSGSWAECSVRGTPLFLVSGALEAS